MRPFAALVLVTTLSMPLAAQDPPAVPATLTLEQALEIARVRNPALRTARNDTRGAAATERRRWGAYLPDLSASFSLGGSSSRNVTGQDDAGEPFRLPNPREFPGSRASQSLSLSYTLFDGFQRMNQLEAARAGTERAAAAVDAEAARVEAELKRGFFAALGSERLVDVERRLLASAEERLAAQRERLRVASASPEDVLGAEVDLARQRLAVEEAIGQARKDKLILREIMGVEEDIDFDVAGELIEPFDPGRLDADSLVRVAFGANPSVRRAGAEAAQAEHAADAAQGLRWPTIRLDAGVSRGMGLRSYELLTLREETFNPQNRTYSFGASVALPLFTGFQTSSQITQAEVQASNADEVVRTRRLAVERQVRSALIDLDNAYRGVQLAGQVAELSRRRLEMAQERYRLGGMSFIEFQQVVDAAAQSERQAVTASVAFATAVATLEQWVGREVTP